MKKQTEIIRVIKDALVCNFWRQWISMSKLLTKDNSLWQMRNRKSGLWYIHMCLHHDSVALISAASNFLTMQLSNGSQLKKKEARHDILWSWHVSADAEWGGIKFIRQTLTRYRGTYTLCFSLSHSRHSQLSLKCNAC